jgi:hypothetical protein
MEGDQEEVREGGLTHAPLYAQPHRGYDVYTPHRSIVYHDYNHGPDTSVTSSWSRKAQELQVRHDADRVDLRRKEDGRANEMAGSGGRNEVIARSVACRSFHFPFSALSCFFSFPQRSRNRLKVMLGYKDAPIDRNSTDAHEFMGRWDLGTRRSLAQLIDFTGVDTINHEVRRGEGEMGIGREEVVFHFLHAHELSASRQGTFDPHLFLCLRAGGPFLLPAFGLGAV